MNTSLEELERNLEMATELPPQFKVLVLYEDQLSSEHALRLHRHIVAQMTGEGLLETYRWDLKRPDALEGLSAAVTVADIIIVAGEGASELPVETEAALDVGLAQRQMGSGALVALLGRVRCQDEGFCALHFSLQKMASRAGLNFFPGVFDLPEINRTYTFEMIHQRAEQITPTLESILHHRVAPDHCGINK